MVPSMIPQEKVTMLLMIDQKLNKIVNFKIFYFPQRILIVSHEFESNFKKYVSYHINNFNTLSNLLSKSLLIH